MNELGKIISDGKIPRRTLRVLGMTVEFLCLIVFSSKLNAQDKVIWEQTPTFYLEGSGSYVTYKSKLVASNDTTTGIRYGLGSSAGVDRSLGMFYSKETVSTPFELTTSTILANESHIFIYYLWYYFRFGISFDNYATDVKKDGEEYLQIRADGYGGNFSFLLPVSKKTIFLMQTNFFTPGAAVDILQNTVTLGPIMDVDIGAVMDLTKDLLDFTVGFRYKTFSISVDGTSNAELISAPYMGMKMGAQF